MNRRQSNFEVTVQRRQDQDMRLLRTLTIILVLLLISTVPLGVLFLVSLGETDKRYVQTTKILLTVSHLNSLLNPFIYLGGFPEIRDYVKKRYEEMFLPCRATS